MHSIQRDEATRQNESCGAVSVASCDSADSVVLSCSCLCCSVPEMNYTARDIVNGAPCPRGLQAGRSKPQAVHVRRSDRCITTSESVCVDLKNLLSCLSCVSVLVACSTRAWREPSRLELSCVGHSVNSTIRPTDSTPCRVTVRRTERTHARTHGHVDGVRMRPGVTRVHHRVEMGMEPNSAARFASSDSPLWSSCGLQ
jgi:hypothetical protein